jgi:hypothetical protein
MHQQISALPVRRLNLGVGRGADADRSCGRLAEVPEIKFAGNRPTIRLCDGYGPSQRHPQAIAERLKYPPPQRDSGEARHLNGLWIHAKHSVHYLNLSQLMPRLSSNFHRGGISVTSIYRINVKKRRE